MPSGTRAPPLPPQPFLRRPDNARPRGRRGFGNVDLGCTRGHARAMHRPNASRSSSRAPRVRVPSKEQVVLTIANGRIAGTLRRLSKTGGLIQLARPMPAGTLADIHLRTVEGEVSGAIELMQPNGAGQGFRFLRMELEDCHRLESVLKQMRKQGCGEKQPSFIDPLVELAQRTFDSARKRVAALI